MRLAYESLSREREETWRYELLRNAEVSRATSGEVARSTSNLYSSWPRGWGGNWLCLEAASACLYGGVGRLLLRRHFQHRRCTEAGHGEDLLSWNDDRCCRRFRRDCCYYGAIGHTSLPRPSTTVQWLQSPRTHRPFPENALWIHGGSADY